VRSLGQQQRRVGRLPRPRRRRTWPGRAPAGAGPSHPEHVSADGAIAPTTGESGLLACPDLTTAHVHLGLHEVAQHGPNRLNRVVRAHGRAHHAHSRVVPDTLVWGFCPPSSPARHPSAQLGHALRDPLAWQRTPQLEAFEPRVAALRRQSSKEMRRAPTASPYFVQAVHVVDS
jgi:hypothetical protein